MKITEKKLREIIREELLNEYESGYSDLNYAISYLDNSYQDSMSFDQLFYKALESLGILKNIVKNPNVKNAKGDNDFGSPALNKKYFNIVSNVTKKIDKNFQAIKKSMMVIRSAASELVVIDKAHSNKRGR
jgi:hypothetical protein